ncbi:MAG TPA: hypothetical protein VMJ93_01390 [Verrucomicrobiae bacterium]|nr:hypothetical protein [Verrucomicrobiae bacterium]
MANNPVSGIASANNVAPVSNSQVNQPRPAKSANNSAAPQDTVTISPQGRAAQQVAQSGKQQAGGDSDQGGQ